MSTVTYQCPCCDAGLIFNAEKQKFCCEFCLSEFTKDELDGTESAKRAKEKAEADEAFAEQMNEYHCPNCGAEIVADPSTVASSCYFCHNPIVLVGRMTGMMKPDKIVPFKFTKDAAKERFIAYAGKKKFVPRDYLADAQVDHIAGVYYPFWVTDADTRGSYRTVGHRVRTWRAGDYRYTETSDFALEGRGRIHFEDIVSSAISTEDRAMLEGVLPYPADVHENFDMPYLLGFTAKKRDIERESLAEPVRARMQEYTRQLMRREFTDYSSVDRGDAEVEIDRSRWEYTLMPLWILTYRDKKDKLYTYAMNGFTGKFYGELPISLPKIAMLFGGIFLAVFLTIFLIGGLLL